MVPPEYVPYFSTMAAVGATLFGLIFVAISIVPDSTASANAPLERQVRATMAYIALLNPLIISLFALVPGQQIGSMVISLGMFGQLNTLTMALRLMQRAGPVSTRLRHILFVLAGFVLYGYETYFAVRLLASPTDVGAFIGLADLMIGLSIFGVFRAWELIGIQSFHFRDWLSSIRRARKGEDSSKAGDQPGR